MLAALSLAVALVQPVRLDAWRWQIEDMGWTWRATSRDHETVLFTRAVSDASAPQLWVRTERFDGQWKSQAARVALDCASGRATVLEAEQFGGMNLSGVVQDGEADWAAPGELLQPILRSACGS